MNDVATALRELIQVLTADHQGGWWRSIVSTFPAAIVAAVAAIAATRFSVYFDKQATEKNVAISLYNELQKLKEEIDRCINLFPDKNFTTSSAIAARGASCPVYISIGSNLGCLKGGAISAIVGFYSLVLTVPNCGAVDDFLKNDLRTMSHQADVALNKLRSDYPKALT